MVFLPLYIRSSPTIGSTHWCANKSLQSELRSTKQQVVFTWSENTTNNVRNEPPSRAKAPRLQVVNMSWWIWDLTDVRFASHWDQCTLHCIDSGSQLFLSLRCLRFHLYLMSHLYVFISHITWLWFTKSYKTRNNGWSKVTGIFSYLARSGVVDGALLILQPTISWETWIRLKWRFDWLISIWLTIFGGWPGYLLSLVSRF